MIDYNSNKFLSYDILRSAQILLPPYDNNNNNNKGWFISNVIIGIEKFQGALVYNKRWKELLNEQERSNLDNIVNSNDRVCIYKYTGI